MSKYLSDDRPKCLISFSGGETSAYMLWWILKNWSNKYKIKVVFANTGQENEETLLFIEKCSELFNVEVIWVEALIRWGIRVGNKKHIFYSLLDSELFLNNFYSEELRQMEFYKGKERFLIEKIKLGTRHKVVNFETASRNGEPFKKVIEKYGIPNQAQPFCNREMKLYAINSYMKSIGWKKYYSAIGIRADEFDRMNAKRKEKMLLYPLISDKPMTKGKINQWWSLQPFRLKLKGYQGNCKTCWKKSDAKLYTLINENRSQFDFFEEMEKIYGNFIPESRLKLMEERGEFPKLPTVFFRKNRSVLDLVEEAKNFKKLIADDSQALDNQIDLFDLLEEESCDIYAECGTDN